MDEQHIHSDPAIMMDKPVVKGTRITAELILEKLAAGESVEQVPDAHPRLTREDIQAVLRYAVRVLRMDIVGPVFERAVWAQPVMTLLADEGVDRQIVDWLRREGHETTRVAEMDPGVEDDAILAQAVETEALLLTADKDFGELVFRMGRASHGVVLLRLAGLSPEAKARAVASVLAERAEQLKEAFCVIAPGTVRIRSTP